MESVSLKYLNDEDKCYGAAGMAIGLVIFDGEDYLVSLSVDREPGSIMEMTPMFYYSGNPEISAKSSWNRLVGNFSLSVVMLIGNVLCRNMVQRKLDVTPELHNLIHEAALAEGRESCSLEDDEIEHIFSKAFNNLSRVFSHHGVKGVAQTFADRIASRRTLTRMEILDQLSALNMI